MEFKKALLCLSLVATLSPTIVHAEQPSYSYVDGGYVRLDIDDIDFSPSGFFARGSAALGDNWFLQGSFFNADDSNGLIEVEADQVSFGAGYRTGLSDTTTLHATLDYFRVEAEAKHRFHGRESAEEDGYGVSVGVRSMVSDQFELNGSLDYSDSGDSSGVGLGVGAVWYLTNNFGLLAEAGFDDDSNRQYLLGVRLSF